MATKNQLRPYQYPLSSHRGAAGTAARCAVVLLLVPASVLCADGGSRQEKSVQCTSTPHVTISNPSGGVVTVRGWDKPEVHAICTASSPKVTLNCDHVPPSGDAEKVRFSTQVVDAQSAPQERMMNYEVDVPSGASLEIFNPSGSVTVERVSGDDWVESVNGSISVLDGSGHTSVTSLNGAIQLIRPTGRVEANSIMGDLRFVASESRNIRAQTESGSILFDGDFVPMGEYVLSSYRGNMDITCPGSDSLELRARTLHGKVNNELHLKRRGEPAVSTPGNALFGLQNRGDATVELKSYSGIIHIHPRQ